MRPPFQVFLTTTTIYTGIPPGTLTIFSHVKEKRKQRMEYEYQGTGFTINRLINQPTNR